MRTRNPFLLFLSTSLAALTGGCALGPTALENNRWRYNAVIQRTTQEQLLLNLVRLQYRESPLFLEVGSVSAQFRIAEDFSANGLIREGHHALNPDQLGLSGAIAYEEKPTITFSPLQGRDFVSQLLSPLPLDAILLLAHSGWRIDRVARLTISAVNGLDNASNASGPTPDAAPEFRDFARVMTLWRQLQQEGLLHIGYETREKIAAPPVPRDRVGWGEFIAAAQQGYTARLDPDEKHLTLAGSARTLLWRIPPAARERAELKELVELLGLDPDLSEYAITTSIGGQPETGVEIGRRTVVNIATRSLMGTMFYLSQAVETPEAHRKSGVVTTTLNPDGTPFDWREVTGGLLRIHARRLPPVGAAVAAYYRGWWFYIDDADLHSKSTFSFLSQLFALQAGSVESVTPVLTLPIGG